MAITYPRTFPSSPGFKSSRFGIAYSTGEFFGYSSKVRTTTELDGARWMAELVLPPMKRATAAPWIALGVSLRGKGKTVYVSDPDATAPLGSGGGTLTVNGASQTGNTLAVSSSEVLTAILKAGDYIEVNSRLHMVLEDATTDSNGDVTLSIEPKLRESPSNGAAVTTSNCKVKMHLLEDEFAWDADHVARFGLAFQLIEAL